MDQRQTDDLPQPGNFPAFGAPLSPEQRRQVQRLFDQSRLGLRESRPDHDAIHGRLLECIAADPGNVSFHELLLENLRHKYGHSGRGSPLHALRSPARIREAVAERDWESSFQAGPDRLKTNPWDVETLGLLAEASQGAGLAEAAGFFVRASLDADATNPEVNRRAARVLEGIGQFEEATECWRRVLEEEPGDAEAEQMIARLAAAPAETPGVDASPTNNGLGADAQRSPSRGWGTGTAEGMGSALGAEGEAGRAQITRRQQLEQAIQQHPEEEANYLALAEFLVQQKRTFEAQRTLIKARAVSSDLRILERLEDVNMLRANEQVEIARRRAAEEKTSDAYALVERLKEDVARVELEVFRARCDRYPQNGALKFEVGRRLKALGNFREAIDYLQGGFDTLEHRAAASLEIGEILQRYRQYPKALQCYRQAAQLSAGREHDREIRTRALYRAGVLAASMQLNDTAGEYLAELVRTEPAYKDARDRLDKLNESGQNM